MSVKKAVPVSIVLLLLTLTIGNVKVVSSNDTLTKDITFTSSQYTEHDPFVIESDAELTEQGWPGNGTEENPYLIEGLSIKSDSSASCIRISNTRKHVLLRDCGIQTESESHYNYGIYLVNTENITIERCEINYDHRGIWVEESSGIEIRMNVIVPNSIESYGNGIFLYRSFDCKILANEIGTYRYDIYTWSDGIEVLESNNCSFSDNRIIGHARSVEVLDSNYSEITENTMHSCHYGIYLSGSNQSQITKNTIYLASYVGVVIRTSSNASIYSNHVGWNTINAQENGTSNQWDDGISEGNYWSDYSGEGTYIIDGSASSVDHFPSLWNEDVFGPEFQCPYFPNWVGTTVMLAPGYTWGRIDSYLISVNVTDPAGVDCVQMVRKASLSNGYYEWINYTMKHDPLLNNPNRYTYNCSFQEHGDIVNFYFTANDTLGNWNITTDYWLESRVIVKVPSTSVDVLDSIFLNPIVFSGMIGGIIVLILLYRHRK